MRKNFNSSDHFESVYLKARDGFSVDACKIGVKHDDVAFIEARKTWRRFHNVFEVSGFGLEDLRAVARYYIVRYFDRESIRNRPDKLAVFEARVKARNGADAVITEELIEKKDKSNLISYIGQRLTYMAKTCGIKNANIIGSTGFKGAYKTKIFDVDHKKRLLTSPSQFEKIPVSQYNEIRKLKGIKGNQVFYHEGYYYLHNELDFPHQTYPDDDMSWDRIEQASWDFHEHPSAEDDFERKYNHSSLLNRFKMMDREEKILALKEVIHNACESSVRDLAKDELAQITKKRKKRKKKVALRCKKEVVVARD